MFWADELLSGQKGKQVVSDAWTPSGIVHMGGLKGPVIHDVLFQILKTQREDVSYIFGFDDMDPIDGLPAELQEKLGSYMGFPISVAPAPDGEGTFGEYYGKKMREMFQKLNIHAEIYLASERYKRGRYNEAIKIVLDNAQKVRDVYADMYKKSIASDWYPLQVICPNCGKLGTTKVTGWHGNEVSYFCSPNLVTWANGCGTTGNISPYDGNAKMPWKVEWAAKWFTYGVTIEGAGKDHASAGSSIDVARRILTDVFEQKHLPLNFGYEFFLSGGKKMSSSKGLGLTGEQLLQVLPPEVVRFLMIKTPPQRAVEFDVTRIPQIYDDYRLAAFSKSEKVEEDSTSDLKKAFELSQIDGVKEPPQVSFSQLAQWVQMPNMDEKITEEGLSEWASYARTWVEKYAPESEKFLIQEHLPDNAKHLSGEQKKYLGEVAKELENDWKPEDFQKRLYELSKEMSLSPKDAFSAIYTVLIGKDHGPKAAWLLLSLDKKFFEERIASL